jgi:hypothetical protein
LPWFEVLRGRFWDEVDVVECAAHVISP